MSAQEWWRGATLYQIYPRSFFDSNADGVGDLRGVAEKLAYIADLGVDGIWLSPFYQSPMKDFGYDVSDYRRVDPIFGTLDDFDALLQRAHDLKLKVIIDQVWSHTSDRHAWFQASSADRHGPYADWYVWADAKPDGSPPNNWQSQFGGPSWTWSPRRRQYYLHNFLSSQPDLNFWSPAVRAEILDTARFWLDRGVDGFRLDVINFLFHDRDLRDNPVRTHTKTPPMATLFQRHIMDRSRPETVGFLADLRAVMDAYPDRMAVGEIFDEDPLARQVEYTTGPDALHTAYSFFLLDARRLEPTLFASALTAWSGKGGWPSWSLGNHDVTRFPSRLGVSADPDGVRAALACLFALRGTIFLYQGEELGLAQGEVPFERLRDPFAIAAYTGESFRDGARTPMPWCADLINAGFSNAEETWLPVDPKHKPFAVQTQTHDSQSHWAFTRALIAMRQSQPALRVGEADVRLADETGLMIARTEPESTVICIFNLSAQPRTFSLAGPVDATPLLAQNLTELSADHVALRGWGFAFLRAR